MSGHWQSRKPMWAIELYTGRLASDKRSDAPLLFRTRELARARLHFYKTISATPAPIRVVKVRVKYEECK